MNKTAWCDLHIGIANLSAYTRQEDQARIQATLKTMGVKAITPASNLAARCRYLCGTDRERLQGLYGLLAHPEVNIIMLQRGGYGALRLLPSLDVALISRYHKPMVGMSDVTAFFIHAYQRTGKLFFHGPNLFREFLQAPNSINKQDILAKLQLRPGDDLFNLYSHASPVVLSAGTAYARLIGGNLSTIAAMAGTGHIAPFAGHILFIEDVAERPYRVDRMLAQCAMSDLFADLAGVLIGNFEAQVPAHEIHLFPDIFKEYFADRGVPVIMGLPFGHGTDKATLPVGLLVRIDESGRIESAETIGAGKRV